MKLAIFTLFFLIASSAYADHRVQYFYIIKAGESVDGLTGEQLEPKAEVMVRCISRAQHVEKCKVDVTYSKKFTVFIEASAGKAKCFLYEFSENKKKVVLRKEFEGKNETTQETDGRFDCKVTYKTEGAM